jgi:ubiquinol-cytochrome c reductase subunit 7
VLKALSRLSPKESYDRIYRIRRATQLSLQQKILPRAEWTKPEEDRLYLTPVLEQLYAEAKEKDALDTLTVAKKH